MNYFKKSLGQNFLIDANIIKKIVNLVEVKNNNIIEIGPGQGALTEEILKKKPKTLSLIEKDASFFKELKLKYTKKNNIKIYNKDILSFNLEKICLKNSIIFGNLPYNISSQILVKILRFKKWPPNFTDIVFMFQKELGEKIIGKFLTPHYGRLSILSNLKLDIVKKFLVSANCFFPKPKIISMIIHFQPKKKIFNIKKINNLEKVTNLFFSNKRKMINKNLIKLLDKNQINKISGLKFNLRPADIKPEIYYKITELFEKK
jgi:16S rRNA (adenine1518-N6/adenine1519-N6)-dimethyltransferase